MVIETIKILRKELLLQRKNKTIGLVPTMGALHDGHLSLIRRARNENNVVVLSIFINPTQFSPHEDFDIYPRDLDKDIELAYKNGVDYVFVPETKEMYGGNFSTYVSVEGPMTDKLCGLSRPTHFRGVATVITKLFNIVAPHRAYFGLKDVQQLRVINKLVADLNFDIEIVPCPIVRDKDGLAISSRNAYLSKRERKQALILFQSLKEVASMYNEGNRDALKLREYIINKIKKKNLAQIDYVEIIDFETFEYVYEIYQKALVVLAVKFGNTRLIDNIILEG